MINRGHCPVHLKNLFGEVSSNLSNGNSDIGKEVESKLLSNLNSSQNLNLNLGRKSKDTSKIVLLHQEYHPKDVSRCTLQRIYNETCGPVSRIHWG